MKYFVKFTQRKISKAIKKLDQLSKNKSCNDLVSQVYIALTRNDLTVTQKKLDVLNYFSQERRINMVKVIEKCLVRIFQKRK